MYTAVQNTSNVVEGGNCCIRRNVLEQTLEKGDTVLLLLSRCVHIGQKQHDIVSANECHQTCVIELFTMSLLLLLVSSLVGFLALVQGRLGDLTFVCTRRSLTGGSDTYTHGVDFFLREEVLRFIKPRTLSGGGVVTLTECRVQCDMDISSVAMGVDEP